MGLRARRNNAFQKTSRELSSVCRLDWIKWQKSALLTGELSRGWPWPMRTSWRAFF